MNDLLDSLKALQTFKLEWAQECMKESRRLSPVAFLLTTGAAYRQSGGMPKGFTAVGPPEAAPDDAIVDVMIDMDPGYQQLYGVVCTLLEAKAGAAKVALFESMLEVGLRAGVEDPYGSMVRPFMQVTNTNEKDLMAEFVRLMAERLRAYGVVFVSEAWVRQGERPKPQKQKPPPGKTWERPPLYHDPEAREVLLCFLETREYKRQILVPIEREPHAQRDGGAVRAFGTPQVHDGNWEGRFSNFLKPLN